MLYEILNSPTPTPLLREWTKATLARHSWSDALVTAANVRILPYPDMPRGPDALGLEFIAPKFTIYRAVCERLETTERLTDAIECFHGMANELGREIRGKEATWVLGECSYLQSRWYLCERPLSEFKFRCCRKLEDLGDTAMSTRHYNEAISQYSAALSLNPVALSLNPVAPQGLFVKRSKAYMAGGLWEDALNDANKVCVPSPRAS